MTKKFVKRIGVYKRVLRRRMQQLRPHAWKVKLTRPTAKEIGEEARNELPGFSFSNVARDIRHLTEPGDDYDPEFDLLLRGQVVPEIVERYSETYLASLVKNVLTPKDMDARLRTLPRTRPDGRRFWEEL